MTSIYCHPYPILSFQEAGYLVGHRGAAERSRQGWGGQKGSGGEPGMNLSDPQGPQLLPAAAAALRGQMSRPGKRLQGPAKKRERSRLGTPTSAHPTDVPLPLVLLQVPCFFLPQAQPPPWVLDATSFPGPVAVAEESLGCHRTGVSELSI